ncbi:MAG: hypothetical protein NTV82_10860 [Candidatus Aminicenantes bacterium]|jgi:hypothetical protein|nr:hypothetical protein [Candidatus Aminicenantes bacterium]
MEDLSGLRKAYRTSSLVGAAVIASLFLYAVVVEVGRAWLKPFLGFARVENALVLRYAFYAAAIVIVISSRILNSLILRKSRQDDPKAIIRKLSLAAIVSMALGEGPAVMGLALFLLGGFSRDFYMLLIVSLFLEFMYFPRLRNWENYLKDLPLSCRL